MTELNRCGDCIHYADFCSPYALPDEDFAEVGGCRVFKNKADFVEVVRCKNCKHWRQSHKGIMTTVGYCHNDDFPFLCERTPCTREEDYCSFGERKENE